MKILIFGSGSAVIHYIEKNKEFFKNNVEILAFLDNNRQKWGGYLLGKEIIPPQNIFKYEYDVILICSSYQKEIYTQLVFSMGISKVKIYTRRDFFENHIFKWYDKKYDLYNKEILIISENEGTDEDYKKYYGRYCDLLNISGIISLKDTDKIKSYTYDYIFFTNFKPVGIQNEQDNIKKNCTLSEKLSIDKYKLLTLEVVWIYFTNIKKIEFNKNHGIKNFLIIRPNIYNAGLGTIALMVVKCVAYAKEKGYIPVVDMKTIKTQYVEDNEYGKINAYNKFFEQPDVYDIYDIKDAKCIAVMYGVEWLSEKGSNLVFPKMKKELYNKYCIFRKKFHNKKVLGVLFRGTDYANLKPYKHNIQPDLNTMIETVKQKITEWGGFDLIYLCTEVQEACERFEYELGKEKVCYYPQLRYKSDTKKFLADVSLDTGKRTEQAKDYWVALNCLASCNSIVAGQCSGTTVALTINNQKFEHSYLFDLGIYGIDDV